MKSSFLNDYYIYKLLEEQENVKTFQVWNTEYEKFLQVKVIKSLSKEQKKNMTKEAYQWISLGMHPNIVSAYFMHEDSSNLQLLLEPVFGKKLSEVLQTESNFENLLIFALEIINGLAYLHKNNIAWGNLSPDNILLDQDGRIRLNNIRWHSYQGLEKVARGLQSELYPTLTNQIKKNLHTHFLYLPPEFFLQSNYTPTWSGDIYALGVLLYELFTRKSLFAMPDNVYNTFSIYSEKHYKGEYSISLPYKELELLIKNCISKNPMARPQNIYEVIKILKDIYKNTTGKTYVFEGWSENITWSMALNNHALGYIAKKDYKEAKTIFDNIFQWHMTPLCSILNYSLLQLKQEKTTFADFAYKMQEYKYYHVPNAIYLLGKVCLEYGCCIEKAYKLIKTEKNLSILEADLLYRLGEYQQASEIYKREAENSNRQDIWYKYGACLYALKLSKDAQSIWEQGLTKEIPSKELHIDYSLLLASLGQLTTAKQYLKTIQEYPQSQKKLSTWSHTKTLENSEQFHIIDVTISQDKRYILGRNISGNTYMWEWPSGKCCYSLTENENSTTKKKQYSSLFIKFSDIALIPDLSMAITANGDEIARLWNLKTTTCIMEWKEHTAPITNVKILPNAKNFITASFDHTIRLWDIQKKESEYVFEGHTDIVHYIALSSNGKFLASASWDNTIRIWDIEQRKCISTLHTPKAAKTLCISSDSKIIVANFHDSSLYIWDTEKNVLLNILQSHYSMIHNLSISDDSQMILAISCDGIIDVYENLENNFCPLYTTAPFLLAQFPAPIPLEKRQNLLELNKKVHHFLINHQALEAYQSYQQLLFEQKDMINAEISPANTKEFFKFLRDRNYVQKNINFSYLATVIFFESIVSFFTHDDFCTLWTSTGIGKQWRLGTGGDIQTWKRSVSFTKAIYDSNHIIYLGDTQGKIHIYFENKKEWKILENICSPITALYLKDSFLICGHDNGALEVWNTKTLELVEKLSLSKAPITSICSIDTNDNVTWFYVSSLDHTIQGFNLSTQDIQQFSLDSPITAMVSFNQKFYIACLNGTLQEYDIISGEQFLIAKYDDVITSLYRDEEFLLIGTEQGNLILYNIATKQTVWKQQHASCVHQVFLTSDHEWAFALHKNYTLEIWKLTWNWRK